MKVMRTASVKLNVSSQEKQILLQTLESYTNAYNFCCSIGFENNTKNGIVLHKLTYQNTRKYLPSQLAISARMVATESLKSVFSKQKKQPTKVLKCPHSKRTSVRFDVNSHTIWFDKSLISILTTQGRLRLPFNIN
jgi:predicted transposase